MNLEPLNEVELAFLEANNLCKTEIEWIAKNEDKYENTLHMQAVIGNVRKTYYLRKSEQLVKQYHAKKTTGAMFELFEHFGLE